MPESNLREQFVNELYLDELLNIIHVVNHIYLFISRMKIMASGPITSWEIDGETVETVQTFTFWGTKSLQMVIAAIKLKDAYSLEDKLWLT